MHNGWKRSFVVAVVGFTATSCHASGSGGVGSSGSAQLSPVAPVFLRPAAECAQFRELAKEVGVQCREPDKGEGCVAQDDSDPVAADYFEVELHPGCDMAGLYGGVVVDRAVLANKLPPRDTMVKAILSKGQLVCIQAIARIGGSISRYYVTAVSASSVAACKVSNLCRIYGDRRIQWPVPPADSSCRLEPSRSKGNCLSGWVAEESLEAFSLGMSGEVGE